MRNDSELNASMDPRNSAGPPEHRASMLFKMRQHADQVTSLLEEKRELLVNVAQQSELLSATLQACENERRGDRTRFDDERRRFETERKNFEDERGAFVNEIARLQAENEEVRASVGPVAHLSERSKHTLGFLPGISTVLEECSICEELLLSGIGTTSFGVMSYSCACSRAGHTRTLHVNCIVSVADLNCSYCREEIVVIAPSLMAQTLVRKIIVRKT